MNEDDLKRALEKLTARLERLERRMGIEEAVDKPAAKAAPQPPPGGAALRAARGGSESRPTKAATLGRKLP